MDEEASRKPGGSSAPDNGPQPPVMLTAFSAGVSAVISLAMAAVAVAERDHFFAGMAVAFAGRAYRAVAFGRFARHWPSSASGDESALTVLKRTAGAYAVGGALCAASGITTHQPLALLLSVLFLLGAAALWFSPRLLEGVGPDGRQWPSRWFP